MSRIKAYNYEKYSIFDITEYLNQKGLTTRYYFEKNRPKSLHVVNTNIYIDFPLVDNINDLVFAQIRFEDYPKTENFNQDKILFETLKKKFSIKKNEKISNIKDWNRIQLLLKEYENKGL